MSSVMFTTEQAIEQLLRSPRLPLVAQDFQVILEAERKKRQQFYDEISESEKIEFINGEIVVQSPVKWHRNEVSFNLAMLLAAYVRRHGLGRASHEKLLVSLTRNDYEPDVCFWRQETVQHFARDQMKFPAPDFVAEVFPTFHRRPQQRIRIVAPNMRIMRYIA